ncbi:F-box/kelch-repeat protein [Trifolium repens]|nr:F-box/kelch-repeat protein [Trifolium repens]
MDMKLKTLDFFLREQVRSVYFVCILMKMGSAIRVFQDLQTHFIRIRDFTGKKDMTSITRSSGRITGDFAIWEEEEEGYSPEWCSMKTLPIFMKEDSTK